MAYFNLLQQFNLLLPAIGGWGGPNTIGLQDIVSTPDGLQVTISSSKTIKTQAQAVALLVPGLPSSLLYPIRAWYCVSKRSSHASRAYGHPP